MEASPEQNLEGDREAQGVGGDNRELPDCLSKDDDGSGMAVEDVAWCSIHQWFPVFAKKSIKTRLVTLPKEVLVTPVNPAPSSSTLHSHAQASWHEHSALGPQVVEYLKADTIVLPGAPPADDEAPIIPLQQFSSSSNLPWRISRMRKPQDSDDSWSDDGEGPSEVVSFPETEAAIEADPLPPLPPSLLLTLSLLKRLP
jgi:hypothetical protein